MKKSITINLYGQLYAIDEEACQMLERYLDSMKKHFCRVDGGTEISDDVEHRVAEILWDKKQSGLQEVDAATVQEIIARIGRPSEIDDNREEEHREAGPAQGSFSDNLRDATATAGKAASQILSDVNVRLKKRRLFRDGRNKVLGGVCSGLAQYFGGQDPTIWRILLLVMSYFTVGISLAVYIIMWIVVPLAVTPEDRLVMKGLQVNDENLKVQAQEDCNLTTGSASKIFKVLLVLLLVVYVVWFVYVIITGVGFLSIFPCVLFHLFS